MDETSELRRVNGDSLAEPLFFSDPPAEEGCIDSTLFPTFDEANTTVSSGLKSGPKKILVPVVDVGVSNLCGENTLEHVVGVPASDPKPSERTSGEPSYPPLEIYKPVFLRFL